MSKKGKAESSGAEGSSDEREFPIDDIKIDLIKNPRNLTAPKDSVKTLLNNSEYYGEIFVFHISLSGTNKYYERDIALKKLKIPRIATVVPDMYLVRISRTGDQIQKLDAVIKKTEKELKEKCDTAEVYITVYPGPVYFGNEFVNYEHKYCKDEKKGKGRHDDDATGASGAVSVEQGLAKLSLAEHRRRQTR